MADMCVLDEVQVFIFSVSVSAYYSGIIDR